MRVQPCPACGARYNASRLEDGVAFQCRRCGADVVVGSPAPNAHGAPGLALGGLLMIAASFLYANPRFGYRPRWPWEELRSASGWLERATVGLWVAAGVWALLASLVPLRRLRAAVAVALACPLLLLTAGVGAAFRVDGAAGWEGWEEIVLLVLLGAGVLLAPEHARRRTGRTLALFGGLLWIGWLATTGRGPTGGTALEDLLEQMAATVSSGEHEAPSPSRLWREVLPAASLLLAACLGIAVAAGVTARGVAFGAFVLLLAGFLLPALSDVVGDFEALEEKDRIRNVAFAGIVGSGLAIWLLGAFSVVDLARACRDREEEGSP